MTALGKLIRTTTFKLTIVYLTVFSLFAAFLLGYFAWNTRRLFTAQINATVDAEVNGLAEQYRSGGIRRLVQVIESRSAQPGSNLSCHRASPGGAEPDRPMSLPRASSSTLRRANSR